MFFLWLCSIYCHHQKVLYYWPFVTETTSDQWIPLIDGQWSRAIWRLASKNKSHQISVNRCIRCISKQTWPLTTDNKSKNNFFKFNVAGASSASQELCPLVLFCCALFWFCISRFFLPFLQGSLICSLIFWLLWCYETNLKNMNKWITKIYNKLFMQPKQHSKTKPYIHALYMGCTVG